MECTMPRVFLSYCHDNLSQATKLHGELSAAGVKVLWDQDFSAGSDFRAAIRKAMSAADFVVACFSKQTDARDLNGIYPEVRDALDTQRQKGPLDSYLIPVRLEKCEIPDFETSGTTTLRHLIHVDVYGRKRNAGVQRLLKALGADASDPDKTSTTELDVGPVPTGRSTKSWPVGTGPTTTESIIALSRLPKSHDTGVFEGRDDVLAELDSMWEDVLADRDGRARIVSLVAVGGAGKTTVASRWKANVLAREEHGGVERSFDWSFYSQGTRDSAGTGAAKGAKLAELVGRHRSLLILDGLEPLQHPPGPQAGELQDDRLRALFAGLAQSGIGLCLVTTRERVTDLVPTELLTTPYRPLDHLTDTAGAAVLQAHGVTGPDQELCEASAEVKGHALTLSLMGRFLSLAFDPPDIARRDCFKFEEADRETSTVKAGRGHAFRVFAAYEQWLEREGRDVEVAILRLLGLFDRPATPDCLAALCAEPLPGLSEPLVGLGERQWTAALNRLRDLDLIETTEWQPVPVTGYAEEDAQAIWEAGYESTHDVGPPQPFTTPHSRLPTTHSIDAHPLLREYFGERLKDEGKRQNEDTDSSFSLPPSSFHAAQLRLYEHLCASVPYSTACSRCIRPSPTAARPDASRMPASTCIATASSAAPPDRTRTTAERNSGCWAWTWRRWPVSSLSRGRGSRPS
jgi:hypothetical protein